jgi:hypothetical protein
MPDTHDTFPIEALVPGFVAPTLPTNYSLRAAHLGHRRADRWQGADAHGRLRGAGPLGTQGSVN